MLTEPGSTTTLGQALDSLPGLQTLLVDAAYQEQHAGDDLGVEVGPDQLAYIYFTSGSTGEPKGAMCEHAGMLNHLYAKIEDLGIGAGQVVAQTAPQCFDISMWQLVSGLLVGGRTLLVEQEVILDVRRFLDEIADGRVAVLQVVPSYLEVVLSYLEQHPRELQDLRCVSVTGEALKSELVQRWFAARPGVKLVNAYGLTETSDDTNHEVMDRAPQGDRVPLGRTVNNVRVYVVDEHLAPVPLGAAGLIAFSGVCVGRGYVNDPERTRWPTWPTRTARASGFTWAGISAAGGRTASWSSWADGTARSRSAASASRPARSRTPCCGCPVSATARWWSPGRAGQGKRLVAFYCGPRPLEAAALRDRLGESLPGYMVPAAFHWRETLPLTANSKIDKKSLTALAGELDDGAAGPDYHSARHAAERRLAAAWAAVLGIGRIRSAGTTTSSTAAARHFRP